MNGNSSTAVCCLWKMSFCITFPAFPIVLLPCGLTGVFIFKTTELKMALLTRWLSCSVHTRKTLKWRASGCLNKGHDSCGLSWFFVCLFSIFQWTQVKLQEEQGSMLKLHSGCPAPKAVEKGCRVPGLLCWITREGLFQRTHWSIRGKPMFLIWVLLQLKKYLQSSISVLQDHDLSYLANHKLDFYFK